MAAYPVLSECGCYSLMRLAENSRALIRIDAPSGGMTIPFLKDILRQAKLFVRPFQTDISIDEAKKFCSPQEVNILVIPYNKFNPEFCSCQSRRSFARSVMSTFPLSILETHC